MGKRILALVLLVKQPYLGEEDPPVKQPHIEEDEPPALIVKQPYLGEEDPPVFLPVLVSVESVIFVVHLSTLVIKVPPRSVDLANCHVR